MLEARSNCSACPRNCCNADMPSFCKTSKEIQVCRVGLHYFEEPLISGQKGSGTVFFGGCNLKCCYCQNYEISIEQKFVKQYSIKELSECFRRLEGEGANNINLVTPSHYVDKIKRTLDIYKPDIPIVFNTSSYDKADVIKGLKGYVDIFLADLKYFDPELSKKYSQCKDYFSIASQAVLQMRKIQPDDVIADGLMKKGMIIRHMVLPSHIEDSFKILDFIKLKLETTLVSLMRQYTPHGKAHEFKQINRPLTSYEYNKVVEYAKKLDLNGFVQDKDSVGKEYIPQWGKY